MDQPALLLPLTQMVALRADLSGNPAVRELLARTRSGMIDALARQHVPFGQVVAGLDLPTDRSRTQVFQTIMTLHTEQGLSPHLPGVALKPFIVGSPQVLHDVVGEAWRNVAGISQAFRCGTNPFHGRHRCRDGPPARGGVAGGRG